MPTPLKPRVAPLVQGDPNRTAVIYWINRKSKHLNGHAALIIDINSWLATGEGDDALSVTSCETDNDWYVSWLGGKIDWKPGRGSWGGNKGIYHNFSQDMEQWSGQELEGGYGQHYPIKWVILQGLNTAAMRDTWLAARTKEGAHWHLLRKNCATMAHTILKAGGGDESATARKKHPVWWPSDVIRYAKSMENAGNVLQTSGLTEAQFQ